MALYNNARYEGGGSQPVRIPGTVALAIKSGDFMVLVSNKASPASALGDSGTLAQNQEAAHDALMGTALDAKVAGATKDVLIQPDGMHRYPCAALGQAYDPGQWFGLAGTGSGGLVGVADQIVVPVATANLAVGVLKHAASSGDTEVWLEIGAAKGTVSGGTQTPA